MARLTKEAMSLKRRVQAKLDGFEQRQEQRRLARDFHAHLYRVYAARRGGQLDWFTAGLFWLRKHKYRYTLTERYKVKIVELAIGVTLYYDGLGRLSYTRRVRPNGYETVELWTASSAATD